MNGLIERLRGNKDVCTMLGRFIGGNCSKMVGDVLITMHVDHDCAVRKIYAKDEAGNEAWFEPGGAYAKE